MLLLLHNLTNVIIRLALKEVELQKRMVAHLMEEKQTLKMQIDKYTTNT